LGFGNILIDLGEVYALPGRRWNVMIEGPDGHVSLTRGAVAQSAGRATPFTADGSWHHLLDPLTGRSSNRFSSVAVTAPLAMEADYLSTALYVAQPERHARILRRVPLARAYVTTADTT
jgi:thiamine biosynthesis lipoprotein